MPSKDFLSQLAVKRLMLTPLGPKCLEESVEVVIFGSMSVGLERPDSDIDIMCFGSNNFKSKSEQLDLIGMPAEARESTLWRKSELASHIVTYGTWIKGSCTWLTDARVGDQAIEVKRRRIAAFVKALPHAWQSLDEIFRVKYSIKIRRETQRLILMEHGTPVPPTRILDDFWDSVSRKPEAVHDRLYQFTASSHRCFTKDLLGRIGKSFPPPPRSRPTGDWLTCAAPH